MNITDVRVRLVEDNTERLRAFCTITIDKEFVVRDIKIIEGTKGLFVAMPSRKLTDHCPKCHSLVFTKQKSKRAICDEYEIHWKTLQKILAHEEPPGYRLKKPRPKPKKSRY